jgi:hypothetical protein
MGGIKKWSVVMAGLLALLIALPIFASWNTERKQRNGWREEAEGIVASNEAKARPYCDMEDDGTHQCWGDCGPRLPKIQEQDLGEPGWRERLTDLRAFEDCAVSGGDRWERRFCHEHPKDKRCYEVFPDGSVHDYNREHQQQ